MRIQNGEYTERGLARLLGISQPQIHHVLKGTRRLQPEFADRIMARFGVSVLDLLQEEELSMELRSRQPELGDAGWHANAQRKPEGDPWVKVPLSSGRKPAGTLPGSDVRHGSFSFNLNRRRSSFLPRFDDKRNPPHCERTAFQMAWLCRSDSDQCVHEWNTHDQQICSGTVN
jgi:transcriptional regulator with XRE-family HTH domain